MIKVQWIDIIRAEGPIALCGKFNRFETFKEADKFLRESSRTCHPEWV